jgi:hypothetical protein
MWEFLLSWLVWLSADPVTLDHEYPRAAAAVAAARASMAIEAPAKAANCPTGKCVPGVAPATASPARPIGGR